MNDGTIFFSYSRADSDFTTRLAKKLVDADINIWLDKFNIEAGEKWDNEIQKALESSGILLVILSKSSVKSENVMDEVSYAIGKGKKVIPVLIEECEVPFRIRRLQYANFIRSYEEGLMTLTEALDLNNEKRKKLLGGQPGSLPVKKPKSDERKAPHKKIFIMAVTVVALLIVAVWFIVFKPGRSDPEALLTKNEILNSSPLNKTDLSIPPIDFNIKSGTTLVYRSARLARKDTFMIASSETLENLMTAMISHYKISPPKDLADAYASEKGGYRLKEALWKNNLPVNNYYSSVKDAGLKDFDVIEFRYELTNSKPMACPPSPVTIRIDGLKHPDANLYLNGKHVAEFSEIKDQSGYFYFTSVMECNPDSWYCELLFNNQSHNLSSPQVLSDALADTVFLSFNLPAKFQ